MAAWPPITRDDLRNAAGRAGFDTVFPLLIRRLIAETADGLTELDMPGGSGVAAGGFDGVVTCTGTTVEVPAGRSVWELSVTSKTGAKVDSDYKKRTVGPDGGFPSDFIYVQVMLAPWINARTWSAARSSEGRWKDVRGVNLDALHGWLDRAPATTAWLADQLGKTMPGVLAADDWLTNVWLPSTTVPLSDDIVLAGRDSSASSLVSALSSGKPFITMAGNLTAEEFQAVVAASLTRAGSILDEKLKSRSLLVSNEASLRQLVAQRQPLILVLVDPRLAAQLPAGHGHQLVVRVPSGSTADVAVGPVDNQVASTLLQATGETWDRAQRLGALARRSLSGLRRLLAHNPAAYRPPWADNTDALRRRLMLVGSWEGSNPKDREIIEALTGSAYQDVEDAALALTGTEGIPMIGRLDEHWHLLAADDVWMLLHDQLTSDDIDAFFSAARRVLTESDPYFGMDQVARLMLQISGEGHRYSRPLRNGLATTLALVGSHEITLPGTSSTTGTELARHPVREIFSAANADDSYSSWSGLRDVLELLAEAAPEEFLDAMRDGLGGPNPVHASMFTDSTNSDSILGPGPSHSEFLWALENLAWSPSYFDDVVDVLAGLAAIDPGGRYSNRPHQSLVDTFSCWRPTTMADQEQRLAALRRLLHTLPDVTRRLLVALIPTGHETQLSRPGPRFRPAKQNITLTHAQVVDNTAAVVDLLFDDLHGRPERYISLINKIEKLGTGHRQRLADELTVLGETLDDDAGRAMLHDALLSKTTHHREYANTAWSLPEPMLDILEQATVDLAPRNTRATVSWLFTSAWVTLGDVSLREGFDAYERAVLHRRGEAIGVVLAEEGLTGVAELARATDHPYLVGAGLAEHTASYDDQMLSWLGQEQERYEAGFAYFRRRLQDEGLDLLNTLLNKAGDRDATKAALLRATADPVAAWSRLPKLGEDVSRAYWERFSPFGLGQDFVAVRQATEGLLTVKRYAAALQLISLYSTRIDTAEVAEVTAEACERLLAEETPDLELGILSTHDFSQLVGLLHRNLDTLGAQRVITIEWHLFPALGFEPEAPVLHAALSADPAFFAELVGYIDRRYDATEYTDNDESIQTSVAMARRATEILHSWRKCPGTAEDGFVSSEALLPWVSTARTHLYQRNLLKRGDNEIGRILAHADPDADGTTPPVAVRDLLEEIESDHLDEGLEIEIANKRGVTTSGLYDGGGQERELAATYRTAAGQAALWPRTKRMLRRLADRYDYEARVHDAEAERLRRGLGRG